MGRIVFNCLVWMGRLFMASLFLLMVIIFIPFAGVFSIFDYHTRKKLEKVPTEFID